MHSTDITPPNRRSLLKWATHGLGVLFAAALGVPAIAYLIDPRKRPAPQNDFRRVARLSELKEAVPYQVVIHDIRRDAWTLHPNDVIGRVWVVKLGEGDAAADYRVFTTVCPHLGCSVNFVEKGKLFICPCHGGTFELTGQRLEKPGFTNPAPRGMDQLECRRDPSDPQLIQVKYQNFIQGQPTAIPKA